MHNRIDNSISFSGLKVLGTVSGKNVEKLGKFTSRTEIQNFMIDLEKTFETDMVLSSDIEKVSFSHNKYGDLTDFGAPVIESSGVFSDILTLFSKIKSSLTKAEKDFEKTHANTFRRGC